MLSGVKRTLASVVNKFAPQLYYYAADRAQRRGTKVIKRSDCIDIIHRDGAKSVRIGRHHAIYVVDIIECFDYYFLSVRPAQQDMQGRKLELVDFSRTDKHWVEGFDEFPITFSGLPEPMITAQQYLDFAQLEQGGVVIDLGSYSALTSIVFANAVGAFGRVVALEPDPISFVTARTNVDSYEEATGLKNIELVRAAVAGRTGTLRLSSEGTLGSAAASLVGGHRGQVIDVPAYTLDDIAERQNLSKVDFVKIDIEGSEEEVIAASSPFFARFRPKLIIEPHFVRGVSSEEAIKRMLASYGYGCDTIPQIGISKLPLITATPL